MRNDILALKLKAALGSVDDEPGLVLQSGAVVLAAVASSVLDLQDRGHRVSVIDSEVRVDPPIDEDCLFLLDSNWSDVAAILANGAA